MNHKFTTKTPVQTVIHDPAFGSFPGSKAEWLEAVDEAEYQKLK